jgi:predicted phosphodiesterase
MFYQRVYAECGILETRSGLLRGNAKKLRLQIQLMLAVAGAQFQVAESPIIAEVKRRLATRNYLEKHRLLPAANAFYGHTHQPSIDKLTHHSLRLDV